jgi:uncharacterized protein (DUF2267 family)
MEVNMKFHQFVGQVQHRARLASEGEAVRAIQATLETLSERLHPDEAKDLAAQLPQELGTYLRQIDTAERFDLNGFYERVATRESADLPDAVYHARAVMSVLKEAVTAGEIQDVQGQLPEEYGPLFEWNGQE